MLGHDTIGWSEGSLRRVHPKDKTPPHTHSNMVYGVQAMGKGTDLNVSPRQRCTVHLGFLFIKVQRSFNWSVKHLRGIFRTNPDNRCQEHPPLPKHLFPQTLSVLLPGRVGGWWMRGETSLRNQEEVQSERRALNLRGGGGTTRPVWEVGWHLHKDYKQPGVKLNHNQFK